MKLRNMRVEKAPRLMIIPMIDIVFFLLVFFMMSSLSMVEQKTIPVNLPQAANSQVDMSKTQIITITAQGQLYLNKGELPGELFPKRIKIELSRSDNISFLLCADKQVEYGKVIAVLDELKSMGVKKVAVSTEGKSR